MLVDPISLPLKAKETKPITRKCVSMKISTVRGDRDGRIRLPFDVAYKFFALHDKLGFSKASQTVNWLLSQSSSAIETISDFSPLPKAKKQQRVTRKKLKKSSAIESSSKAILSLESKKELRNSARARARERTLEKERLRYIETKNILKTPTWLEEDDMEMFKSFNVNDRSLIAMENRCEIIEQRFELGDAMMWQDNLWEDCISHLL